MVKYTNTYNPNNISTFIKWTKYSTDTFKWDEGQRKIWMKRAIVLRLYLENRITLEDYNDRLDTFNNDWRILNTASKTGKACADNQFNQWTRKTDMMERLQKKLKKKRGEI